MNTTILRNIKMVSQYEDIIYIFLFKDGEDRFNILGFHGTVPGKNFIFKIILWYIRCETKQKNRPALG